MPASTSHPLHKQWASKALKTRTVASGEEAVKSMGETFLPQLSGLSRKEYEDYKERAQFYNATRRTLSALVGSVFRRDATFTRPSELDSVISDIDLDGTTANHFTKQVLKEVLTVGRHGVLVDYDSTSQRPYCTHYIGESIINHKMGYQNGIMQLEMVVLAEQVPMHGDDEFDTKYQTQHRVLRLQDGIYTQQVYYLDGKKETAGPIVTPTINGRPLEYIPFVIINTTSVGCDYEDSPLLDLVNLNINHYKFSADVGHALHFTSLPTPYATGIDSYGSESRETTPLRIGSTNMLMLPQGASVGMLEFSGAGVGSLRQYLNDVEGKMGKLGARLLEKPSSQPETAESHNIRQAAEGSALITVVESVDAGITQAIKYCADYMGIDIDQVDVELNRDFIASQMDSKSLIDMIKAYQDGGISEETLYYQMHKGEILPPDHNKQEEITRLQGLKQPVEQPDVEDSAMDSGVEGQPEVHNPVTEPNEFVSHFREMIEQGMTDEEILKMHPELSRLFNQNNI
jgi:hypothetical protein